jgi:spore photoproduct lyase
MIKEVWRKSLNIKKSGRSSDYITPSFIFGCLYRCAYCTCQRYTDEISIGTNVDQMLSQVDKHIATLGEKIPNQTHDKYWTYDIG